MKIVLDTNVLISALLHPHSSSASVLKQILIGSVILLADERILLEYEEVVTRPKFNFDKENALIICDFLRNQCQETFPAHIDVNLPDKYDAPFIETALTGKADFIVTGNKKHFPAKSCKGIKIVSPTIFLKFSSIK